MVKQMIMTSCSLYYKIQKTRRKKEKSKNIQIIDQCVFDKLMDNYKKKGTNKWPALWNVNLLMKFVYLT